MELNTNQTISNEINSSLQKIPKYNPTNFVEDCLQINALLNSELRNQSDFKICLNILRAILRDNKTLFGPLFQNLIKQYLSILDKENIVPEEYIFLLVDILHNKSAIKISYWHYYGQKIYFKGKTENNIIVYKLYYSNYIDKVIIVSSSIPLNKYSNYIESHLLNDLKII